MKLINQILFFIAASITYARVDILKANKCEITLNEHYKKCFDYEGITMDNLESYCNFYHSSNCQKLYNEGNTILNDCKVLDLESRSSVEKKYVDYFINFEVICSKNEFNQSCPMAYYHIFRNSNQSEARKAFNQYINDTCKSKRCTEIAIDATKKDIQLFKGSDYETKSPVDSSSLNKPYDGSIVNSEYEIDYTLAFLKSNYCSSHNQNSPYTNTYQPQTTNSYNTSNASSKKIINISFFIILILLSILI